MQNSPDKSSVWDPQTRALVRISAAVAVADINQVRQELTEGMSVASAGKVEEALLQNYLFAGFPRTLNAMKAWREISGLKAPESDPASGIEHAPRWEAEGKETCRAVYGDVYEALRNNIFALHPALDSWMIVDGYGKVLSRPGLDLIRRELCIVAICAAAEQVPQLRSHIRGVINVGGTEEDLHHTINAISDFMSESAVQVAMRELKKLDQRSRKKTYRNLEGEN